MTNKKTENNTASVKTGMVRKIYEYTRSDNGHKAIALTLDVRFKKEEKSVKVEESHGFKKFTDMVRQASKEIGVKSYYTGFIAEYKYDENGEYIRDEFGDRVKSNVGGWLFEVAGGGDYDKALLLKAVERAKEILVKGVEAGDFILAEKKEKKASKKVTKTELEAENNLLKKQMAEMMERLAALEKAAK